MDWKNCADFLPANGQHVLVCIKGVYHVACFSQVRREFEEIDSGKLHSLAGQEEAIYWTTTPEPLPLINE